MPIRQNKVRRIWLTARSNDVGRIRSACGLGGPPFKLEEPTLLLQPGDQGVEMGAAGGCRFGQAEGVHGQLPQLEASGRRRDGFISGQDTVCAFTGQARGQSAAVELEGSEDHAIKGRGNEHYLGSRSTNSIRSNELGRPRNVRVGLQQRTEEG